ncbi:hypothetical protein PsorP6_007446 [Peronosclerospora sorghi]|uniref:Uncharacterized protein n=1 Tax=Peronosclerospora sorghi TaxID=230839 RepID=A0ACC0WBN6_9STRA|nr:hypothetical protein PsorP6_007446 [Peronosclerospora sorghi]
MVDDDEQYDDIIDEDTLFHNAVKLLQAAKADCGVVGGKKRARKNYEENESLMPENELKKIVSGCGNCYKGDAFQYGSCPFLDKPDFNPGMEKVLLNLNNAADI